MNKLNQFAIAYLKWTSPIAFIAATLSGFGKSGDTFFYQITGVVTIIWILLLMYLIFSLALQEQLRNRFVRWIAGIKENDERESLIAGIACKKTFIFMTGFIVLLIFLSIIRINIYQYKTLGPDGKKNGQASVSFAVNFVRGDSDNNSINPNDSDRNYLIHYNGFPLAVDGTLFLVGLVQIGAFYYFSRKENQT